MSRSFRKGYLPHHTSDKYARNLYSRSLRRKVKRVLREQMFAPEDKEPIEVLASKGVDYGCRYSDPWSWPSDGRTYFVDDLSTLHQQFDEEIFGAEFSWRGKDSWEEYKILRKAKVEVTPCKWSLSYDPYIGDRLETTIEWFFDPEEGNHRREITTKPVPVYGERVTIILDHHPYVSDVPKDAGRVYFYKIRNHSIPGRDDCIMDFLFHRNLIPLDFTNRDQFISWLLKNEERIIRSWYKVLYKK